MPAVPEAKSTEPMGGLAELGIGATWLLGVGAVLQVLDLLVGASPLGAAIAGAVLVDLAADRAGVRWDGRAGRGRGKKLPWRVAARRVLTGAGRALCAVLLAVGVGWALGWAHGGLGRPSVTAGILLLRVTAVAVRDELLFRGIPLAAAHRARVPRPAAELFAAAAGAASIALLPGSNPAAVALAFGSGWLFASLWRLGAWAAIGAHAVWLLLLGGLLRGQLLDIEWGPGLLGLGVHSAGAPAWLAAGAAVAVAVADRLFAARARRTAPGASS
jgi:uncharacterized protein